MTETAVKPQASARTRTLVRMFSAGWEGVIPPRLFNLWRRRELLWKSAAVGLLIGTMLALVLPTRYESTTRLMPPDSPSGSGGTMLAALTALNSSRMGMDPAAGKSSLDLSSLANEALGMKSTGALFVGILRSQTVEDRLVERFNLRKVYRVRYLQDGRKKLEDRTSIFEDRKSGIISITVTDNDRRRAAALAQANIEELDLMVAQLSTSAARRERIFLEGRLAKVKDDLERASQRFGQFSSANKTIELKDEARAVLRSSATIEGQLIAAESELEALKTIYSDENVRVRALHGRVAELRQQLEKLGGQQGTKPGQTESSADGSLPTVRSLPILGVTYADLYVRMRIEEVVFESLTQQYELAKVQEAKEIPSVKVLDPPNVPERKSFPPRLIIIVSSGLLALAGAVACTLANEHWSGIAADDPGKIFVGEVLETVNTKMPWASPNGSRFQQVANRLWVKSTTYFKKVDE